MLSYPDNGNKIQDFVTRPVTPVEDITGDGKFSISPLGFPETNYSGEALATKIIPTFKVTYKDSKFYRNSDDDYSETVESGVIRRNLIVSATNNTVTLDSDAEEDNDIYVGYTISIHSGEGIGQTLDIVGYNGSSRIATLSNNFDSSF